mgnify:CR=1 FL=1
MVYSIFDRCARCHLIHRCSARKLVESAIFLSDNERHWAYRKIEGGFRLACTFACSQFPRYCVVTDEFSSLYRALTLSPAKIETLLRIHRKTVVRFLDSRMILHERFPRVSLTRSGDLRVYHADSSPAIARRSCLTVLACCWSSVGPVWGRETRVCISWIVENLCHAPMLIFSGVWRNSRKFEKECLSLSLSLVFDEHHVRVCKFRLAYYYARVS